MVLQFFVNPISSARNKRKKSRAEQQENAEGSWEAKLGNRVH
jgi:hypothetical protein